MQRKLAGYIGYFALSFVSFCFFTGVFHVIANAHAATGQATSQQFTNSSTHLPTPTIYTQQLANTQNLKQTTQQSKPPTPTPTIFQTSSPQVLAASTKATTESNPPQPTETPIPPTATPTPTALPTPQPTEPATTDLDSLFNKYGSQYSVNVDQLKKIANCESGFNTNSDTGLYAGMFQFSAGTWESIRGTMGQDPNPDLRKNAEEAIKTAAFMLSRGEANAWPNCH